MSLAARGVACGARFRAAVAAVDRRLYALIDSGAGGPVLDDLRAAPDVTRPESCATSW